MPKNICPADLELWPMILTFELDLDSVNTNQRVKHLVRNVHINVASAKVLLGHGTQTKIPGTTLWKEMFLVVFFEGSHQRSCCSDTGQKSSRIVQKLSSTHTHTHTRTTAVSGWLKWSVKVAGAKPWCFASHSHAGLISDNNVITDRVVLRWCTVWCSEPMASSGFGARGRQNYMSHIKWHRMLQRTRFNLYTAATELPQVLLQNTKYVWGGNRTKSRSNFVQLSSELKKLNSYKSRGHLPQWPL